MNDTKHTPTPWRIEYTGEDEGQILSIVHGQGRSIIKPDIYFDYDTGYVRVKLSSCNYESDYDEQHLTDMDFLIRACNYHNELVAALEDTMQYVPAYGGGVPCDTGIGTLAEAQAILAKVKNAK